MKINKSLLLKIMNTSKTISVWGLAGVGCLTIFSLLFMVNEWLAIIFPYLICFSIFAAERIKRYTTLKHKVCRFWKYIAVLAGCGSIVYVGYSFIATYAEEKETAKDVPAIAAPSPSEDERKYICDCKLVEISPCFCARSTPDSLKLTLRNATPVRKDKDYATITESAPRHKDGNPVPLGRCGFTMTTEKIKLKQKAYTKKVSIKIPGLFDIYLSKKKNDKFMKNNGIKRFCSMEKFLGLFCSYLENTSVSPEISLHSVSKDDIAVFNLRMPTAGEAGITNSVVEINIRLDVYYSWSGKKCNVIH